MEMGIEKPSDDSDFSAEQDASPIRIRLFQPADLRILQTITVESFEGVSIDRNIEAIFGPFGGHDWRWRKSRHIQQDVERDAAGVFVAECDGEVVGYITTWIDEEAGMGHIPNLAVTAPARGRGVGRMLIEHALDHFRSRGAGHARIETLAQNPVGQSLYPSCGFREVARQVHFCRSL